MDSSWLWVKFAELAFRLHEIASPWWVFSFAGYFLAEISIGRVAVWRLLNSLRSAALKSESEELYERRRTSHVGEGKAKLLVASYIG